MIEVKGGMVKVGELVFLTIQDDKGSRRVLAKFESLYDGKVNIRVTSDNTLHSVKLGELTKANPLEVTDYYKGVSLESLKDNAKNLKDKLIEHGLWLEVKQATPEQLQQYKESKALKAAATNIDDKGNIVTEAKKENEPSIQ